MKTYPIKDDSGYPFAVEVEMVYCGLRNLLKVIASSEGVSSAVIGKGQTGSSDVRGTFQFEGEDYVVAEPFGDNSRYWIGPAERSVRRDISSIEERLKGFQPSTLRRIIGGLITLRFAEILGR